MFSFHKSDELVFNEIPSISFQDQSTILQDLVMDHASIDRSDLTTKNLQKKRSKSSATGGNQDDESSNDTRHKKVTHRDIERQRRQEMAKQYASLRSLLPLEYIKGKRSTSDHMHQAVSYINHLQQNIKELDKKRDKLKKLSTISIAQPKNIGNSSNNCLPQIISVSSCWCGFEILISSEENFTLSIVLEILLEEGLDVVSCVSTEVNERFLHTIQAEVSGLTCNDPSVLQEKLTNLINSRSPVTTNPENSTRKTGRGIINNGGKGSGFLTFLNSNVDGEQDIAEFEIPRVT
ncbi:hypothetical protein RJ640_022920 [Escallonia rubra]|uniref:BHLH domain-containing protein n=1 Tax=Escallonia rubra TaxID=112253 RepID=A0AA88UG95_9ASTE|nr:hypothetical protein RJ640_022920 [Escallonia rubra]